jgi:hypothetical protein
MRVHLGGWVQCLRRRRMKPSRCVSVNNPAHNLYGVLGTVHPFRGRLPRRTRGCRRFSMLLLAAFAGLALLLAAVGIYSVLAFAVRRRIREIGIRMALGAELRDILRLIVSEGMKPALIGVAPRTRWRSRTRPRTRQPGLWHQRHRPAEVHSCCRSPVLRGTNGQHRPCAARYQNRTHPRLARRVILRPLSS